MYLRKAGDRGAVNMGWLSSHHSFSFGSYYDPAHMGISVLRVINDDVVQPGQGFGTHGHRDMEIISYVIEGALEHRDSAGNGSVIPAGDIQKMSAGKGILHSEMNASDEEPVNFLQIWIQPNVAGIDPEYEQKTIQPSGQATLLVSPDGKDGSLKINQDALMYRLDLEPGEKLELTTPERVGYLHVIQGQAGAGGIELESGDGLGVGFRKQLELEATTPFQALWFDLPRAGYIPD